MLAVASVIAIGVVAGRTYFKRRNGEWHGRWMLRGTREMSRYINGKWEFREITLEEYEELNCTRDS